MDKIYDDIVFVSLIYKDIDNPDIIFANKACKNYALSFVKIVGKSCVPVWDKDSIYISIYCKHFYKPLFTFKLNFRLDKSYRIDIIVGSEFLEYCSNGTIGSFPEFSTEQAIKQNVYPLIDSIVKALRLVSLV